MRYALIALTLLATIGAFAAEDAPPFATDKYKDLIRTTGWTWDQERANVLASLQEASTAYEIGLTRPAGDDRRLKLRVMDGERVVHTWWGHPESVFVLTKDRLYYVNFVTEAPGGIVVAVDVKAGKKLWESPLRGIGRPPHFAYDNRVNILANSEIVTVYGNESGGRYFEIKDANTGETVGHKTFKVPAIAPKPQ